MSVRRLAEITVQPPSFAFSGAYTPQVETWIGKFPEGRQQSAVIPLLMLAQEQEGWISKAAIETIADMLRMPYIRALEVATFYTQFQLKPTGSKAHVQVCGTTPCMLRGSEALMAVCRAKIHPEQFHLNGAGTLSWEEVECLGACVNAPMVMIWKDAYEDLTPERLGEIIDSFEAGQGAGVPVGPQSGRAVSIPASGQTTLVDEEVFLKAARERREARERDATTTTAEASVPPSYAAKPATDAPETAPAFKSPSPVKDEGKAEATKESEAPAHDTKAADAPEPAVEGDKTERTRPIRPVEPEATALKAPELQKKPQAGESGKAVSEATSLAIQADKPLGDTSVTATGVSDVGTNMGASVNPENAPVPAPGFARAHPGGFNPVEVSDSNKARPGDDQRVAEAEGGYAPPTGLPPEHPDRPPGGVEPERPDDLTAVNGVTPAMVDALHRMAIYTFAQVAEWTPAQRRWTDEYMGLHGRIERDDWIGQAQAFVRGGAAEHARLFPRQPD